MLFRSLIAAVLEAEAGAQGVLSADAERLLLQHAWPGNIRQLGHVLRTAAALADGKPITREHLPSMRSAPEPSAAPAQHVLESIGAALLGHAADDADVPPVKLNPIQSNERQVLLQMLKQHRWNVSNVAKALDVSRNTLYRKLHKLHIEVSHPE